MANTSRCNQRTPASVAQKAAKAAGTSGETTSACAQSRKVLRGRPTAPAAARSL